MNTRLSRKEAKRRYGLLYDEVEAILFRRDPKSINFVENADEYASEVAAILPRLKEAKVREDVAIIVHEVFVFFFGSAEAGQPELYEDASSEIWDAWQRFQRHKSN